MADLAEGSAAPARQRNGSGPKVVNLVRQQDGISRAELARRMGLTTQAISKIVARLELDGLVTESRLAAGGSHPRTMLSLVSDARFAIGIHLDRHRGAAILVNLLGETVASTSLSYDTVPDPAATVELLSRAVKDMVGRCPAPADRIAGCGLAMAGPVDHRTGVATAPNNFSGWKDVPIAEMLSSAVGLPVKLDKETNMATMANQWMSRRAGWEIVIYVGTGIGGTLMLDGELYRGRNSGAGELGHMVLDPSGPWCVCGRRGCVEVLASPAAVVHRYKQMPAESPTVQPDAAWNSSTIGNLKLIATAAGQGEIAAIDALKESGRLLGIAANSLASVLDVEDIVLAGPLLGTLGEHYIGGVRIGLAETRWGTAVAPRLTVDSSLYSEMIAVGAAICTLQDVGT
ncbi:MAG: ROK family transcriptional regulator [Bifidobacteriaceae bacterium]|jgi:predicted NBD/HSP70 family sugar kinase|nr:ROK family transcriptional regulator [Bifidobacteriaceae bacterium]